MDSFFYTRLSSFFERLKKGFEKYRKANQSTFDDPAILALRRGTISGLLSLIIGLSAYTQTQKQVTLQTLKETVPAPHELDLLFQRLHYLPLSPFAFQHHQINVGWSSGKDLSWISYYDPSTERFAAPHVWSKNQKIRLQLENSVSFEPGASGLLKILNEIHRNPYQSPPIGLSKAKTSSNWIDPKELRY